MFLGSMVVLYTGLLNPNYLLKKSYGKKLATKAMAVQYSQMHVALLCGLSVKTRICNLACLAFIVFFDVPFLYLYWLLCG